MICHHLHWERARSKYLRSVMDFKIANALNLSHELVMLNRRAYEEEISSLSSDELVGHGCYSGHFPEMPHDDLGSDGNNSPAHRDRRDDSQEVVCTIDDDFSHALFEQEQMLICFKNAELTCDYSHRLTTTTTTTTEAYGTSSLMVPPNPQPDDTALKCPPSVGLQIDYSPSPAESTLSDASISGPMVPSENSPSEALLPSIFVPSLCNSALRLRKVDIAAWQMVLLRDFFQEDHNQPGRQRLRELSEKTHLPISIISIWFAEKRRCLRLRLKFGFSHRTPGITTIGHGRFN